MGSISRKCFACQYDINLVLAIDSCVLSKFECVRKRQNTDDITFKRRSLQSIIIKNEEMGPFLGSSTTAMFCIIQQQTCEAAEAQCCCEIWLGKTFFEIALGINTLCIPSWHAKSQAYRLTCKAADLPPLVVLSLVYLQSVIIIRKSVRTFMAWSYLQGKEIEMLRHLSMNS